MQDSFQLAAVLGQYLKRAGYTPGRLAQQAHLPRATVVNWSTGRVQQPRQWQDLVRVADVLGLNKSDTTRLLRSAGHMSVEELLAYAGNDKDKVLLRRWAAETLEPHYQPPVGLDPATLADARHRLAALPLDTLPDPAPLPPGSHMPLRRNPFFVGREADLRALARLLVGGATAAISQAETAAATGIGGIGKTQLAVEFVHRYGQYYSGVFWLSFADPDSVPLAVAACGGPIGMALHPHFGTLPLDEQVQRVLAAWQSPLPRLLVFDNCEDEALLNQWHPASGGCFVLVTSRRADWESTLGVRALPLDILSRTQSIALLRKYRPDLATDDLMLDAIAAELGDLPLALHLAGAYLERYRHVVTLTDYLGQLRNPLLLEHPSLQGGTRSPTGHAQHVARTFALSYDKLDPGDSIDVLASAMLARAAFFAPGEPIPRGLLLATLDVTNMGPDAAIAAEDALGRLVALGLMSTGTEGTLRLHRLVIRFVLGRIDDPDAQAAVEQTVLERAQQLNDARDLHELAALHPHLRFVAEQAMGRDDERAAALCSTLGHYLWMVADYNGAQRYLERALVIREQAPMPNPINIAASLNLLGLLFQAQGTFRKARAFFEQALALWSESFGPDDLTTAAVHNNLGHLLVFLGDYAGAQSHLAQGLETRRRVLGLRHGKTALSLNNLGHLCLQRGQYARARRYLKLALAIRRQVLPPDHLSTARTLNFLGEVLSAQGRYAEAQTYFEEALAMRRRVYGDTHYDTAESMHHLGLVLYAQGDTTRGRGYVEEALVICEMVLGKHHPDTIRSREVIAALNA